MRDGSPGADLETLVRRFAGLVRAAVASVDRRRGRDLAEDVEQTVFLNLWRQLSREQIIVSPASYLWKSAVRETVRLLKAESRLPTDSLEDVGSDPPDRRAGADHAVSDAFDGALATLSDLRRRAVRAHLEGFSVHEIMKMYSWSYQRARNLVARGMADLRAALRERGVDG